ncbi:type II toxin-antitoxin system RelE/ParE family toxin [Bosea sp. TAF32]|uniref:type II toxin-antitoxin system RelE/ParE family toxin n=1 Tax=Bosea sp. TAF32 TaxID=3237482 RepID=UPI003F8E80A4
MQSMPEDIKDQVGFRLRRLQNGEHGNDRHIKRFGEDQRISDLIKIVAEGDDGNTYRCAVTVEFDEGLWVIDIFEKRASSGISTPKKDIDRIADRLKRLRVFRQTPEGLKVIAGMEAESEASRRRSMPGHGSMRKPQGGR